MSGRQTVTYPYPPCSITVAYPILQRVPPEERAAWVAQAERGEELTAEQNARLGMLAEPGGVLIPSDPKVPLSEAQLGFAFPHENRRALAEIIVLGRQRGAA